MITRGAGLATALWLAICLPLPDPAVAQGPGGRGLALVDFAVRAPDGSSENLTWLGPAVSELLQAKLQHFGGARVLERQRVRALLWEAKTDSAAAAEDPGKLAGILPAEILIAGSVSVDPEDSRRIRVQARAFEVETSRIVAEAAFSGTGELAGLLKIAADLAKTLADALKLAYTPEQLAYAEPAKIDTLRLFVAGEQHAAAGRFSEAITAFQKALDGNGGRYYAAAHRLQGEAYQALAKASAGDRERAVREEYLKKFRDDAVAAAGALFDLGLAYEANSMWEDAAGTYRDYLDSLGGEGRIVVWRSDLRKHFAGLRGASASGHGRGVTYATAYQILPAADGSVVALVTTGENRYNPQQGTWETLTEHPVLAKIDGATGRPVAEVPLDELLGFAWTPDSLFEVRLIGVTGDQVVVAWEHRTTPARGEWERRNAWAAAVDFSRRVAWRWELGEAGCSLRQGHLSARMVHLLFDRNAGRVRDAFLATLDLTDGRLLSRATFTPAQVVSGEDSLTGLDLAAATFGNREAEIDLATGKTIRPGPGPLPRGAVTHPRPTGVPGLRYASKESGVSFSQGGVEVAFFEGWRLYPVETRGEPRAVNRGPLLLTPLRSAQRGYLVVDPSTWKTVHLFGEAGDGPSPGVLAYGENHLLFLIQVPASTDKAPGGFAAPKGGGSYVFVVYDVRAGTLRTREAPLLGAVTIFVGEGDIVQSEYGVLQRIAFAPRPAVEFARPAEAQLRRAACLISLGDTAGAAAAVDDFNKDFPRDVRGTLMRMRIARAQGDVRAAADFGVEALHVGSLEPTEIEECAVALRAVHPELRAAIATPVKTRLLFRSLTERGRLVCTWSEPVGGRLPHLIVDLESRASRVVVVEGIAHTSPEPIRYSGSRLAAVEQEGGRLGDETFLVVDLESGDRRIEERSPLPEDAAELLETYAERKTLFLAGGLAVRADPVAFTESGKAEVTVSEVADRAEIKRVEVPLSSETIAAACADRGGFVVTVSGGSYPAYRDGGRGAWFRVEHYPLGPDAQRWTYEAEGWIGGNPVFEGDRVTLAVYEGRVPRVTTTGGTGPQNPYRLDREPLALMRISLDRRTGKKVAESPLRGSPGWHSLPTGRDSPWYGRKVNIQPSSRNLVASAGGFDGLHDLFTPWPPRCLFPGWEHSIRRYPGGACGSWWLYDPGKPPVIVEAEPHAAGFRVVRSAVPAHSGTTVDVHLLVANGLVYESTAGGVILVKDFAGGRGLESIAWGRDARRR